MKRVSIIGISGSGKTTTGRRLSTQLGAPHTELDSLFWQPGWQEPDHDEFRETVKEAVAGDSWVVDGNYSRFGRDLIWDRADTVVWLDYPFMVSFWMLLKRSIRRAAKREELWNGNRETFRNLLDQDSLLWYVIRNRRRIALKNATDLAAYPHLELIRLESPGEVDAWLASLRG